MRNKKLGYYCKPPKNKITNYFKEKLSPDNPDDPPEVLPKEAYKSDDLGPTSHLKVEVPPSSILYNLL